MRSCDSETGLIAWLMNGDPAIRWQAQRDLLDKPESVWRKEQRRSEREGWVRRLLDLQARDGAWGEGIYTPKWTSTTYTLLQLREMGLAGECAAGAAGASAILAQLRDPLPAIDTCVTGMWLALGAYFGLQDPKLQLLATRILDEQMPDGGWNCRKNRGATHSSVHTTLNVLDGVREALARGIGPAAKLRAAEARAIEFLLVHSLYKSHRTGNVMNRQFTQFSFPTRWHYDVLRGLDYLRTMPAIRDARIADAFGLVESRRRGDGTWAMQNRHRGKEHFDMEPGRSGSRWITLRAMRCLRARGGC